MPVTAEAIERAAARHMELGGLPEMTDEQLAEAAMLLDSHRPDSEKPAK